MKKNLLLTFIFIMGVSCNVKAGIVAVNEKDNRSNEEIRRDEAKEEMQGQLWRACTKLVSSFYECSGLPRDCSEPGLNIVDSSNKYIKECLDKVEIVDNLAKGSEQETEKDSVQKTEEEE